MCGLRGKPTDVISGEDERPVNESMEHEADAPLDRWWERRHDAASVEQAFGV